MVSPNVRVNTFFPQKEKRFIDPLSKFYIGLGTILGLNRLPVILNKAKYILTSLAFVYSVLLFAGFIYVEEISSNGPLNRYKAVVMNKVEFLFCIILSLITWKRFERYYSDLNKFDVEIGCRPKETYQSIKNLILMIVFSILFTSFYCFSYVWGYKGREDLDAHMIPVFLLHFVELFYYGHLLSLIVPRLGFIRFFVAKELSSKANTTWPNIVEYESFKNKFNKNADMKRLMDLYYIIVKTYESLMEAVKWQLLVIIITTFISTLTFCYAAALTIIRVEDPLTDILWGVIMMLAQMFPLFSPCINGDQVHGEVRRLRELIASRLYENKLDKSGRTAARSLLALTEARDLSFSLLRMLQVDISLPFKFIGLLVTYLIILLQFEKVINPTTPVNKTELG